MTTESRTVIAPDGSRVSGTVAEGYEPVRAAFVENFARRGEVGAACAVYHRGERVVDLWGGHGALRRPARSGAAGCAVHCAGRPGGISQTYRQRTHYGRVNSNRREREGSL
jgi:hypothetical protein